MSQTNCSDESDMKGKKICGEYLGKSYRIISKRNKDKLQHPVYNYHVYLDNRL